jgi:hypothetical protein
MSGKSNQTPRRRRCKGYDGPAGKGKASVAPKLRAKPMDEQAASRRKAGNDEPPGGEEKP